MADFAIALNKTLQNEGGFKYHTVEGDRGGETYAGISRNAHPDWKGWEYLDTASNTLTEKMSNMVHDFYRREFWDKIQGDKIESQYMAESIFDFAVNAGVKTASTLAQKSLGKDILVADGVIGPKTLRFLNMWCGFENLFHERYFINKIIFYADIANRDKTQSKFLLGWINRALRY